MGHRKYRSNSDPRSEAVSKETLTRKVSRQPNRRKEAGPPGHASFRTNCKRHPAICPGLPHHHPISALISRGGLKISALSNRRSTFRLCRDPGSPRFPRYFRQLGGSTQDVSNRRRIFPTFSNRSNNRTKDQSGSCPLISGGHTHRSRRKPEKTRRLPLAWSTSGFGSHCTRRRRPRGDMLFRPSPTLKRPKR